MCFGSINSKRAASAKGETTPNFEVPSGKCPKQLGLNDEVQGRPMVTTVDSQERAFDALLALEGTTQDASREACAPLEGGIPTEGPPSTGNIMGEAPFAKTIVGPLL